MRRFNPPHPAWITAAFVASALFFAFFGIDRSFWLDEAFSFHLAAVNPGALLKTAAAENNPPLYYIVLHFWMKLAGSGEAGIRSLSALCYLSSVYGVYRIGLLRRKGAFMAAVSAFLFMVSPLAVRHAQNARPYALFALIIVFQSLCFLRSRSAEGRTRYAMGYSLLTLLGMLTHYWFVFVVTGQGAWLILGRQWKGFLRTALAWMGAAIPFVLLWGPAFRSQVDSAAWVWMAPPDAAVLIKSILDFWGGYPFALPLFASGAAFILFQGRKRLEARVPPVPEQDEAAAFSYFLALLLFTTLVPWLVSQARPLFVPGRYTVAALMPASLLVGSLLTRRSGERILVAGLLLLFLGTAAAYIRDRTTVSDSTDRSVTEYLLNEGSPGDILMFTSLSRPPVEYYLLQRGRQNAFTLISFPDELRRHSGWRDVRGMLKRKEAIRTEAQAVGDRVLALMSSFPERRLFLFYGWDLEVSRLIKAELDRRLAPPVSLKQHGSFFTEILVYGRDE